jgi:cell division transport system permease protein
MRLGYFLSQTATGLRRNLLMTIAAISTVAISLLLLGGVLILGHTIKNMTQDWEREVEVQVFLRKNASTGEEAAVRDDLAQMREVKTIDYVSQQEALAEFEKEYEDFARTLPPDALPASYKVELTDAKFAEEVAARIRGSAGVESVKFGGSVVKTLLQVNSLLRTVTLVMSFILMVAAVALIANTIRLAIYARREEIGIMKLVGATNWFIRVPFMLEGVFAALVGAAVSIAVVVGTVKVIFTALGERFLFLQNALSFTTGDLMGVVGWLLVVGTVVGLIGSFMAVRRFLQV